MKKKAADVLLSQVDGVTPRVLGILHGAAKYSDESRMLELIKFAKTGVSAPMFEVIERAVKHHVSDEDLHYLMDMSKAVVNPFALNALRKNRWLKLPESYIQNVIKLGQYKHTNETDFDGFQWLAEKNCPDEVVQFFLMAAIDNAVRNRYHLYHAIKAGYSLDLIKDVYAFAIEALHYNAFVHDAEWALIFDKPEEEVRAAIANGRQNYKRIIGEKPKTPSKPVSGPILGVGKKGKSFHFSKKQHDSGYVITDPAGELFETLNKFNN